jgi:hypothetical protein
MTCKPRAPSWAGPRLIALLTAGLALGCSAEGADDGDGRGGPAAGTFGNAGGSSGGSASGSGGFGTSGGNGANAGATSVPGGDAGQACAIASSAVELEPVHLAFAFDVSGSMGKGDEEWHDKTLKWDPVVLATRTFFEDPASSGLTASLTFFPEDGDDDERCVEAAYTEPDVEMTPLPSSDFAAAIDAIEPMSSDDWRGGTPTAWVMRGTLSFVEAYRDDHPGRFAIVLVTDGYPQGCDEADDTIEAVVAEVETALGSDISTYVIGVANPPVPDAPDTVSDLHEIAAAGGTGQAFLIDTGDPASTSSAFEAAVDEIRETAISCVIAIPPAPAGETFDKEKVAVRYESGSGSMTSFVYDAGCSRTGAWHYDDPASPSEIVLCERTCADVQSDVEAALEVQFACEQLFSVD